MTTTAGNPIADNENLYNSRAKGPVLYKIDQLIEKLAHQNRERIPERVSSYKEIRSFWSFRITEDISKYTKQKFYKKVKNKMCTRFSTVAGEKGSRR